MINFAKSVWPWILIQGILAVIFGIIALAWPGATLLTLAVFFGIWMIVDGVGLLIQAVTDTSGDLADRVLVGLFGVLGVVLGGVVAWNPFTGVEAIALLVAVWFIVAGIREIVFAARVRKVITGEWLLILSGILAVVFGILCLVMPALALGAVVYLIGIGALLFGIFMVVSAIRIRTVATTVTPPQP
ncbi:hypothetical protein BW730_11085 [Tessaracoccus aquimaris]|uniref:HdeD family acid-resistance protein n=1 Tax=Tessaracoccus aquimaris TaxID=1332264 RepID=A0A1Q2CPB6_9ACTN|nr:DUF308 domain-containing protein [Tessaracoccus aquimaris]AQP47953.1 hypothetical protein BW730_11085 [Tessaracoccus aquimaris]